MAQSKNTTYLDVLFCSGSELPGTVRRCEPSWHAHGLLCRAPGSAAWAVLCTTPPQPPNLGPGPRWGDPSRGHSPPSWHLPWEDAWGAPQWCSSSAVSSQLEKGAGCRPVQRGMLGTAVGEPLTLAPCVAVLSQTLVLLSWTLRHHTDQLFPLVSPRVAGTQLSESTYVSSVEKTRLHQTLSP